MHDLTRRISPVHRVTLQTILAIEKGKLYLRRILRSGSPVLKVNIEEVFTYDEEAQGGAGITPAFAGCPARECGITPVV